MVYSVQAASRCFKAHSGESHFEDLSSLSATAVVAIVAERLELPVASVRLTGRRTKKER